MEPIFCFFFTVAQKKKFLLLPTHTGSPKQNPESRKTVVCVCVHCGTSGITSVDKLMQPLQVYHNTATTHDVSCNLPATAEIWYCFVSEPRKAVTVVGIVLWVKVGVKKCSKFSVNTSPGSMTQLTSECLVVQSWRWCYPLLRHSTVRASAAFVTELPAHQHTLGLLLSTLMICTADANHTWCGYQQQCMYGALCQRPQ